MSIFFIFLFILSECSSIRFYFELLTKKYNSSATFSSGKKKQESVNIEDLSWMSETMSYRHM